MIGHSAAKPSKIRLKNKQTKSPPKWSKLYQFFQIQDTLGVFLAHKNSFLQTPMRHLRVNCSKCLNLMWAVVFQKKKIAKDLDICSVNGHHGNLWLPKCVQVCLSVLRSPGNGCCVTPQSSGKVHKTPSASQQSGDFFLWDTSVSRPGILRSAPTNRSASQHFNPDPPSYDPLWGPLDSRVLKVFFFFFFFAWCFLLLLSSCLRV